MPRTYLCSGYRSIFESPSYFYEALGVSHNEHKAGNWEVLGVLHVTPGEIMRALSHKRSSVVSACPPRTTRAAPYKSADSVAIQFVSQFLLS